MKAKFTLMDKKLNLDQVEGKYSAFAKAPFALCVRLSKPLAADGYGTVTVDGVPVPRGVCFHMDTLVRMDCMLVPVGSVATEYDRAYTIAFQGFTASDGTPFRAQRFTFRTMPRGRRDEAYAAHDEVVLQAAREGIVLLKNEGPVLPLAPDAVLNCFGAAQFLFRSSSTGASMINPRWQANFHQSIAEHSSFVVNEEVSGLYRTLRDVLPPEDVISRAKEKNATAMIVLSRTSGEFLDNRCDKGGYYLTDDERAMIRAVAGAFDRTIAVLNTGHPIEMGWVEEYGIDAVLYTGFAGQAGGYALMEILDGRTTPSGKLPDTWAVDYFDYPSAKNFIHFKADDALPGEKDRGVLLYYEEDIYVGYRYFDTFGKRAAYDFGHGLSYTTFDIAPQAWGYDGGAVYAEVCVTNTGTAAGKETVQLYLSLPESLQEQPRRVLVAFEKTQLLQPGQSQRLRLTADDALFATYDARRCLFVLPRGGYTLFCGDSLTQAQPMGSFSLAEEKVLRRTRDINPPPEPFHRLSKARPYIQADSRMVELENRIPHPAKREIWTPPPLKAGKGKITFPMLCADPTLLDAFVAQMTGRELCRLNVCGGANWYMPWQDGSAGKTVALAKYKLPVLKVSDGNTGLNLVKPNLGAPSSTVMAATFNKELIFEVGKAIGEESVAHGIAVNLGPGMNIHRNVLNGRHPEYFSEDPVLAGLMAGFHGKGLLAGGAGCTYKHIYCNNSDTSRKGSHSIVSSRALREIYQRVFETAFSVQRPTCVMTSYNAVNGIYPAENVQVLQGLIRGEWKFDGLIMTDWGTYDTVDPVEMVKAGNCWLTEGSPKYVNILYSAVREGRLPRANLEHNVRCLVRLVLEHSLEKTSRANVLYRK